MTYKIKYLIYGALFGCCFPVISSIFDVLVQGLPFSWESIKQAQASQPLHWVIDTAPLFLGLFAMIAGIKQDELATINQSLERKVEERTRDLHSKNKELSLAERNLSASLEKISQSIDYAQRIQLAIISNAEQMKADFPGSFFLFRPRDVVSGDFLWYYKSNGYTYVAAVDCTGHGVPGAFMSLIGYCMLNKIVSEKSNPDAAEVLNSMHIEIQRILNQKRESEVHDGMEMSLCRINTKNREIQFSGAGMSLFFQPKGQELVPVKADIFSLGGFHFKPGFQYTNQTFNYSAGDRLYMYSDGITDQFNESDVKYGVSRLRKSITSLNGQTGAQMASHFNSEIDNWKKSSRQIDDIMLAGVIL